METDAYATHTHTHNLVNRICTLENIYCSCRKIVFNALQRAFIFVFFFRNGPLRCMVSFFSVFRKTCNFFYAHFPYMFSATVFGFNEGKILFFLYFLSLKLNRNNNVNDLNDTFLSNNPNSSYRFKNKRTLTTNVRAHSMRVYHRREPERHSERCIFQ